MRVSSQKWDNHRAPSGAFFIFTDMTNKEKIEELIGDDQEMLFWDGLDDAIIGFDADTMRCIYSVSKIQEELVKQGMTEDEAVEFYEYNIACSYIGEQTPILCNDGINYL